VKKKRRLLNIIETLTEGVVGNNNISRLTDKVSTHSSAENFANLRDRWNRCENKPAPNTGADPSPPVIYSLQESCNLLQLSCDDLYDDGDKDDCDNDETSFVGNGVNDADRVNRSLDSVDGTLYQSSGHPDNCSDPSEQSGQECSNKTSASYNVNSAGTDMREPFRLDSEADLYMPDVWQSYYSRLQRIGHVMRGREGWLNFDAVFMISATDNDGVLDVKVYYAVSQKNIHNIFDCNSKKSYPTLIIFCTNIFDTTCRQMAFHFFTSACVCFCTNHRKQTKHNRH